MLFRLPTVLPSRHHITVRTNLGALICLALSMTFLVPTVYIEVGHLVGIPNVARLLSDCFGIVMACLSTVVLLSQGASAADARRRAALRFTALGVLLVVMGALFATGGFTVQDVHFLGRYGSSGYLAAYVCPPVVMLGLLTAETAYFCWRYGKQLGGELQVGLWWIALAGTLGFLYSAYNIAYVLSRLGGAGEGVLGGQLTLSRILLGVATLAIAVGDTVPDWGDRLAQAWSGRRSVRRLDPLLADIRSAGIKTPAAALGGSWHRGRLALDPHDQLSQRVLEIRDAQLALQPLIRASVVDGAVRAAHFRGEIPAEQVDAVVEAACIAAAITARRRGLAPAAEATGLRPPPGGTDLYAEAQWLGQVADCYAHSPVVPLVRSLTNSIADAG